jgi:hypothetical protein
LLVPYPFAGDHQRFNAEALARRGAALCVANRDATPERLVREIEALFAEPAKLARMADAARKLGRPDAALHIARDLLALAGFELTSSGAGTLDSSGNAAPSGPGAPPAGADALRAHASDFVATSRSA